MIGEHADEIVSGIIKTHGHGVALCVTGITSIAHGITQLERYDEDTKAKIMIGISIEVAQFLPIDVQEITRLTLMLIQASSRDLADPIANTLIKKDSAGAISLMEVIEKMKGKKDGQ